MTKAQYLKALATLDLTVSSAAKEFGISRHASEQYAAGEEIPHMVQRQIKEALKLHEREAVRKEKLDAARREAMERDMSVEEYREALGKLGLTIMGAGPVLGVSDRNSQRYAAGRLPVSASIRKLLRLAIETKTSGEKLAGL